MELPGLPGYNNNQTALLTRPSVDISVPLKDASGASANIIIDVMKLSEQRYGFEQMHPELKNNEEDDEEDDEDDDENEGAEGSGAGGSNGASTANGDASSNEPQRPKKKTKATLEIGKYDLTDGFIDDSELQWEEQAAATQDGFFIYFGPLVSEEPPKEVAATSKRKNASKDGNSEKRPRQIKPKANSTGDGAQKETKEKKPSKPRAKKSDKDKEKAEKSDKGDTSDKADKAEKPEKPEKEKSDKATKPEKTEKTEKVKTEKSDTSEKSEKSAKAEKSVKTEKTSKAASKADKPDKVEKSQAAPPLPEPLAIPSVAAQTPQSSSDVAATE